MLTLVVNADDDEPAAGTKSGSPSAADLTRTGEPQAGARRDDAASVAAIPSRNPGRYRIIAEHGRGGLGRVSRAHDRDLDREIAIKEMLSGGHLAEVRFLREAMITARLQHPGIVPVYEAGRWPDGTPFYAMKLVAGRPLRELIVECTTVEQRIGLLHHVIAVADAIAYAHDRNIIHRDLKPANVIVGNFGETIVIDWGLAKDLSAAEESSIAGGPFRIASNDLTSAGGVLGTPTYMAPEQERGEPVDQRADVFAIGAMLWELCSPEKIPSVGLRQRHRILGRAGIDRDLVTIIDNALDPEPGRRYPDAASLSADLKAFKSGARIAARRYSLLAILGHWMRRHRALAVSVVAAIALALASGVFYVRSIANERDRVAASNNRLILKHAELLLRDDPTAAFDLLQTYRGADPDRLAMLRAEARGLGLSSVVAKPHTLAVLFAHPTAKDAWVTLSFDGTIAQTTRDGQSKVIARGVTAPYAFDYSDRGHLLAYTCKATSICLLDVHAGASRSAPTDGSSFMPASLAFSPTGDRLAAISSQGETAVWQLSDGGPGRLRYQRSLPGGRSISFVDEDTLAAPTPSHVLLVHLDQGSSAAPTELSVSGTTNMDSGGQHHLVAAGTADGALVIVDSRLSSVVRQETVCKGHVNKVLVLSVPRGFAYAGFAYACQDGNAGIWDPEQNKLRVLAHIEGGAANIVVTADGRYAVVGGNNGNLLVYDFTTQMLSSYLGHATRLTQLLPPSPDSPYIVSGDTTGAMRVWSPPVATTRVAIETAALMYSAMLLANGGPLVAVGTDATIPWYARDGTSGALQGHAPSRLGIAPSPVESRFATYGYGVDDEVELWSFEPGTTNRTLKLPHSAATAATFTADGTHLMTGSSDGTLTEWSNDGATRREVGTVHESVEFLRAVPSTGMFVVGGASDDLWLATATGIAFLGKETDRITSAVCSYDSRWLAVGTSGGVVRLYNLLTRQSSTVLSTQALIENLAFSRDSTSLAIATKSNVILSSIAGSASAQGARKQDTGWHEVGPSIRYIAFSPDDKWLAVTCDHGDIWFYRRSDNHWVYVSVGTAKVPFGKFSDDGAYFAATDSSGRALLLDMHASIFD
jgi:WD40 repeat protein